MSIDNKKIEAMRKGGKYLAAIIDEVAKNVKAGISTLDLETLTIKLLKKNNLKSAFLGFNGYPSNICVSINDEIVHAIPKKDRIIKQGDLVSIDMGLNYDGYVTDMATTVAVGDISPENQKLLTETKKSLDLVIKKIKAGDKTGKIGQIISSVAKNSNLKVIYELTGHGVGKTLHEDPIIYNYGTESSGMVLEKGMTIAVEPMLSLSCSDLITKADNWTIATKDGSNSAHFEHTLLILDNSVEILTIGG